MKISIITVCYNSAATIEQTIKSVLSQDYPEIEYIIIDGRSTDETLSIISRYRDKIAVVVSEKDCGIYDAMNKGVMLATGNFVGILNADDFYSNESVISSVVKQLKISDADSLYANLLIVDPTHVSHIKRRWISGAYNRRAFLFGWMPPHPTFFVRKEIYSKFGAFNLNLKTAADYELMLRFLYVNRITTTYLNDVIIHMRGGGASNKNIKSKLIANMQDRKAWTINNVQPYFFTIFLKPIRKITQFFFTTKS